MGYTSAAFIVACMFVAQPNDSPVKPTAAPGETTAGVASKKAHPLKSLPPVTRKLVTDRAKHCFQLPDGSILDASEYYNALDAFDDSLTRVAHKTRTPAGGFSVIKTTGYSWKINSSDRAEAYQFGLPRSRFAAPSSALFGSSARTGRELFTFSSDSTVVGSIFIDQDKADRYTRSDESELDGKYSQVGDEFAGRIFRVHVRQFGSGLATNLFVRVPESVKLKGDVLPGRFLLIPDFETPDPTTKRLPNRPVRPTDIRPAGTVYNFVSLDKPISPELLLDAWAAGRFVMHVWTFKAEGDRITWRQSEVPLPSSVTAPTVEEEEK